MNIKISVISSQEKKKHNVGLEQSFFFSKTKNITLNYMKKVYLNLKFNWDGLKDSDKTLKRIIAKEKGFSTYQCSDGVIPTNPLFSHR